VRGHLDLKRVLVATFVCAAVALFVPWEPIQVLAALPLCLFFPGYAIVSLLFAGRELSRAQLVVFSLACSFAALVLGVLLLNYMPGGIRKATWAIYLVLLICACCRGAALRRPRPARRHPRGSRLRLRRRDLALLTSGLLIGAISIALAQMAVPAEKAEGFTALWMLPAKEGAGSVWVGVRSSEQKKEDFVLRVVGTSERPDVSRFRLEPGEERVFRVPVNVGRPRGRITASLYKAAQPENLYRRVNAWVEG
jgi:uncharacterized membrane protein